ncbi:MAG: helix-turn-helix transcriptional regulator [Candidatus Cryosericum sp.]|nr:helix-turn-helix transcriptional regulator [Candidatus Cryosericum sp.]HPS70163.1 helix-turn-helix transcriptional regulator [Candidatus Cryosericum sp.]
MQTDVTKAGATLRALREKSGLTQQNLAAFLGVDQSLISKFETGERSLGVEQLDQLAALLGVDVDVFSSGTLDVPVLRLALRANSISQNDLQAISTINRIALDSDFMARIARINDIDERP